MIDSKQMEIKFEKIDDYRWLIPRSGGMKVPGLIYATEKMMEKIGTEQSSEQVANVAHLPGIVKYSLAMPDIHWGYGFPIGGVAAFDIEKGVISPGGIGFDINCGVRLLRTGLSVNDVKDKIRDLTIGLYNAIPAGVGSKGAIRLSRDDLNKVSTQGASWMVKNGYGREEDLDRIEENGCFAGAEPNNVSDRAFERGKNQLGTVGSGNHFVEIGYVDEVFDEEAARVMGLEKDMITVFIHSGSRGFGYQICDDYLKKMANAAEKYGYDLPDRQLACAPFNSKEGQKYLSAMACAVNYAFSNRQGIMHWAREVFEKVLRLSPSHLEMELVYDVCHNIAKIEEHEVEGAKKTVCVHRKGATRAFAPGHSKIPERYRGIGQPVMIPGDMGRASYVLVGTQRAMDETFGSTCHGAGRLLSRRAATKKAKGRSITREMEDQGVIVMARDRRTIVEEMPEAYKDVSEVVEVTHQSGISKKVVKLRPLGVIKG